MDTLTPQDRLFRSASDTKSNACIDPYVDMTRLARYYKDAGDELAAVVQANNAKLDCLIYPVTYLYRMHVELLLKMIVHAGRRVSDSAGFERSHDLGKLWSEAKGHALAHLPDEPPEWVRDIDRVLQEFMTVDPGSTTFRYGDERLKDLRHINVRNLQEVVHRLGHCLAEISNPLHYAWEQLGK